MAAIRINGFKTLINGDSGTGKTYSIGTLIDTGIHVCYLTLSNEIETIFGYYADRNKPIPANFSYMIVDPPEASVPELIESAKKVNEYSLEMLAKLVDSNKRKYDHHIKFLSALADFVDQRTGESLGSVHQWGVDRVLVIDPLTSLNRAVMDLVVGGKPVRSQSDWGIAQDQLERVLTMLTGDCKCHLVILAHVEKELDAINGGLRITVSTLGKALAPKIPRMFSDVIYSWRDDKWWWSTSNSNVVAKTRNLPFSDKITPDFKQIYDTWKKRYEAGITI